MPASTTPGLVHITGRAKLVTNVSNHDAPPNSFVKFVDLITDVAGRIRKRPGIGAVVGALAGAPVKSMHEFTYVNGATINRYLFRATDQLIQYRKNSAGAWITATLPTFTTTGTTTPTAAGLWVFENADNRCFAVNGADDMIVFDGVNERFFLAGADGPISPMAYKLSGITTLGRITATQGSPTITQLGTAISSLTSVGVTATAVMPGVHNLTTGDSVTITGAGVAAYNGTYNVVVTSSTTFTYTFAGGGAAGGAPVVYAVWPTGAVWVAPFIDINGIRYQVSTVDAGNTITLQQTFREASGAGLSYVVYHGANAWTLPPKYAYAYFNPTTGHCSNIRAAALTGDNVTEIIEQNRVGTDITLSNIVYDSTLYAAGFTKIQIFRTAKNANILQALSNPINNGAAPGSTSFSETGTTFLDTSLTQFPGQRTKLSRPPVGMKAIRYHQGRLWGAKDNRVYYSLSEAEVVGELGNAYESWPPQQSVYVEQTRGLFVVGGDSGDSSLIIQTATGDFTTTGYDRRTIAAFQIQTRKSGSFQFGAIGTEGSIIGLYADKRVIGYPGSNDFGLAIQDKFDATNGTLISSARLTRFTWQSRDFIFLSIAQTSGSTTNDVTYVYDLDNETWYQWNVGFTAFATARNSSTGALELWASTAAGESFQLLQSSVWRDRTVDFAPALKIGLQRPYGEKTRADFQQIEAFVSDPSQAWSGEFLINEQADGGGQAFTLAVAPHQTQDAQGRRMVWTPPSSVRTKANVVQASLTFPTGNQDYYVELLTMQFTPPEAIPTSFGPRPLVQG